MTIVALSCGDPALDRALAEADKPVERAEALRARVEIYALRGDLDLAHHDLDALAELRGFVPNSIHDAEDLRVVALVRAAEGDLAAAERALHEVIRCAELYRQPELQAAASRDLATLRAGRNVGRIALCVLGALAVLVGLLGFSGNLILTLLELGAGAVAAYFMFRRDTKTFFAAGRR